MLVERKMPEGFVWKGNRRKRSLRTPAPPVSVAAKRRRSLDTCNQLATTEKNDAGETFAAWLKRHEDAQDKRRRQHDLHRRLLDSLKTTAHAEEWYANEDLKAWRGERKTAAERTAGAKARKRKWSATKDFERVASCQSEWIGFKAACCNGRAQAVPIGCNHRLCPLCAAQRAEKYRERVRSLFGVIAHPHLLTLTVPNTRFLTARTFQTLRNGLKAFLRDNKALLMGGVYSIECTYNRQTKSWHPHIHILVDVAGDGKRMPYAQFVERKLRLEFDWLVITQGKAVEGRRQWRRGEFDDWACIRRGVVRAVPSGFTRRLVDIRPVRNANGAAVEVLKYITKQAAFVDDAGAVAEFLRAVKGVRVMQTFGSCYRFKMDAKKAPHAHMKCDCGQNDFRPIGVLGMGMVKLSKEGIWYVRDDAPVHGRRSCRGSTTRRQNNGTS